jgi:hypothetical protein
VTFDEKGKAKPLTKRAQARDNELTAEADEIRYMRGLCSLGGKRVYFADTFGLVGRGEGITFTRRNPFAADVPEPARRIDYIFVRGDDRGRGEPLNSFERERVGFTISGGGSDGKRPFEKSGFIAS